LRIILFGDYSVGGLSGFVIILLADYPTCVLSCLQIIRFGDYLVCGLSGLWIILFADYLACELSCLHIVRFGIILFANYPICGLSVRERKLLMTSDEGWERSDLARSALTESSIE
jgi:hypothetical protein